MPSSKYFKYFIITTLYHYNCNCHRCHLCDKRCLRYSSECEKKCPDNCPDNVLICPGLKNFIINEEQFIRLDCLNYIIIQPEICPETNRKHLQIYGQLKENQKISYIQNNIFLKEKAHIEEPRWEAFRNKNYCSKLETRCEGENFKEFGELFEHGIIKKQNKRYNKELTNEIRESKKRINDSIEEEQQKIIEVIREIKDGKNINKLIVDYSEKIPSWGKTIHGIKEIKKAIDSNQLKIIPQKIWEPINIYWYGDSQTGKSYYTKRLFPKACNKTKDRNGWWQEYINEDVIVFNEFYQGTIEWDEFLKITESDKIGLKQKNVNNVPCVSKINIFTSNQSLEDIMDFENEKSWFRDRNATLRRFRPPKSNKMGGGGYIIRMEGSYESGMVTWNFEQGDMKKFFKGEFDIKFNMDELINEEIENLEKIINECEDETKEELQQQMIQLQLEEAKKYVYDNEIDQFFIKNNNIWFIKKTVKPIFKDDEFPEMIDDRTCVVINENYKGEKRKRDDESDNESINSCYSAESNDRRKRRNIKNGKKVTYLL